VLQSHSLTRSRYTKALTAIKDLRKERVSELKADKERLESLSREKGHADKLKSRISDLSAGIGAKEIEYEETQAEYERLVIINKKFHDQAHQFKEMYMKIQNAQERKKRYQEELATARENLQEIEGLQTGG
jgi:DNA repair protein RAD50